MSPSILFLFMLVCTCAERCKDGEEYVDCTNPESQRLADVACNSIQSPTLNKKEECKPGCRCPIPKVRSSKGKCILPTECPCLFGGEEYENGRTVKMSCNQCICNEGVWDCTEKKCTCHLHGDSNVKAFDDTIETFDGTCQFTLATDQCDGDDGDFSIEIQSVSCCKEHAVCTRRTVIIFGNIIATLGDGEETKIFEKTDSTSSQSMASSPFVYSDGLHYIFHLPNGVDIIWVDNRSLSIILPFHWNEKLCGVCGNSMDGIKTLDGSLADGHQPNVNRMTAENVCKNKEQNVFPNDTITECNDWAVKNCNLMRETVFKDCNNKVDPTSYHETCVKSVQKNCACNSGKYSALCTAIALYANDCNLAGVCINWRNSDFCPVSCNHNNEPNKNVLYYESCGAANKKICKNQEGYSSLIEGCYPRCDNAAPYLDINTKTCVRLSGCTCRHMNKIIAANSGFEDECHRSCKCLNGKVTCLGNNQCSPTPV